MREQSFSVLNKVPVGTYFMTYSHETRYTGKNMWVCRVEQRDLTGTTVRFMEGYWSGTDIDNDDMVLSHHDGKSGKRYYSLDSLEMMGGNMLLFSEEDTHSYMMEFI
jgi:hypothetical protein